MFYPVTPGTSGRCQGGKERPARPPPASSHESHVLDNAPATAREPPPTPAPRCLRLRLPFPEEGVAAWPGSCPTGWGARKLEGAGEALGPGRGGGLVTWANLPQGNEVSSRLLGGNGGGRIRPRLTQAGRGISPRSLQPNPLPPPPPGRLRGTSAQRRESPGPPALPRGWCFFPSRLPRPHPSAGRPGIARRGEGPRGGADVTPWEAGWQPSAGAAEAAAEHAART